MLTEEKDKARHQHFTCRRDCGVAERIFWSYLTIQDSGQSASAQPQPHSEISSLKCFVLRYDTLIIGPGEWTDVETVASTVHDMLKKMQGRRLTSGD